MEQTATQTKPLDFSQFLPAEKPKSRRITENVLLPILSAIEQIGTSYKTKGQFVGNSVEKQLAGIRQRDLEEIESKNAAIDRALKLKGIEGAEEERLSKKTARETAESEAKTKKEREQKFRERAILLQSLPESEREAKAKELFAELDPENYASRIAFPKGENDKPLTQQDIFTQENQLRNQYEGVTKDFRTVRDAYGKIKTIADSPPSAAGDMGLVFGFMKILDPGSTVRETEYANAQNAAGVPERIRVMYNRALDGQLLGENQRADFLNRSRQLYSTMESQYKNINSQYKTIAKSYELDPDRVAVDYLLKEVVEKLGDNARKDTSSVKTPKIIRISTDAEWEALAPGTPFIDPNGVKRVK